MTKQKKRLFFLINFMTQRKKGPTTQDFLSLFFCVYIPFPSLAASRAPPGFRPFFLSRGLGPQRRPSFRLGSGSGRTATQTARAHRHGAREKKDMFSFFCFTFSFVFSVKKCAHMFDPLLGVFLGVPARDPVASRPTGSRAAHSGRPSAARQSAQRSRRCARR